MAEKPCDRCLTVPCVTAIVTFGTGRWASKMTKIMENQFTLCEQCVDEFTDDFQNWKASWLAEGDAPAEEVA